MRLDQLGVPSARTSTLRLRCLGVPDSVRSRLEAAGAELTDDPDAPVTALVVSTRLAPEELANISDVLGGRVGRTVVLAHTSAERLAGELVRAGADAIVGEGNEEALIGLVDESRLATRLLGAFEQRFGFGSAADSRGIDHATGLADRRSFERRVANLIDADEMPRVGYGQVVSERWSTTRADPIVSAQRRRLATGLAHVAVPAGAEVYATGNGEFGVVGVALSPHELQRLGVRLVATAATFRDRGQPLRLVVGHAGPESARDAEKLLALARRATEVAAADADRPVLNAEELALGVSVTTELEAAVRLLDAVEPAMIEGLGHGERVGRMAAELARLRDASPAVVNRAQLAAHLHDVGRAGLPPEAVGGPGELGGELLEAWRTFPARSAALLQLTAGPEVAAVVRSQREHYDGGGFPDGLKSGAIPEAARILAVVHAVDEVLASDRNAGTEAVSARLREGAGTLFDPEIVVTAIEHVAALTRLCN